MTNTLISGDPMNPCSTDLIAQQTSLLVGQPVPEGWRVLSGNTQFSTIARVAYRYEVEEDEAKPPIRFRNLISVGGGSE